MGRMMGVKSSAVAIVPKGHPIIVFGPIRLKSRKDGRIIGISSFSGAWRVGFGCPNTSPFCLFNFSSGKRPKPAQAYRRIKIRILFCESASNRAEVPPAGRRRACLAEALRRRVILAFRFCHKFFATNDNHPSTYVNHPPEGRGNHPHRHAHPHPHRRIFASHCQIPPGGPSKPFYRTTPNRIMFLL